MSQKIQAVRGMNDLLPAQIDIWHQVEAALREIGWRYGYQEIRTPMLEKTALFKQSIGDQTDIVEKEMYTFTDSGEESLSLRPEATASTVRACIEHGALHNRQERLWYMGPMFRRERPQKGRYRQFHQFGIEAFGWSGPDIDGEIIRVGERVWKQLKVQGISLHINTLGSEVSRRKYRAALSAYLSQHKNALDDDSLRRLESNPLRILDSKNLNTQEIIASSPSMMDYLEFEEKQHFDDLCASLEIHSIDYVIDPKLVRGLDYYTSTVFEWTTEQLGAQSAVCAGGRYDTLVGNRGGKPTPAIGFAMGMERLVELVEMQQNIQVEDKNAIYFADVCDPASQVSSVLAERLRDNDFRVISHYGGGKLRNQLKRADQSGAAVAIILGDSEYRNETVQIKNLRRNGSQTEVHFDQLIQWCVHNLADSKD